MVCKRYQSAHLHSGHVQRWLMPYADMLTVLFVVMLALQQVTPSFVKTGETTPQPYNQHPVAAKTPILSPSNKQTLQKLHVAWQAKPNEVKLTLPGAVLFDSDKTDLSATGSRLLMRLAPVLATCRGKLRIEGHTDDVLTTDLMRTNRVLSAERAARVADFLTEQQGLDPRQILATGYGATQPLLPNSTTGGRQQNRRVVIVMEE